MMMTSADIIDVNESSFEYEVINYSNNIPVVVDFWATWCRPCKVIGPMLEKIAAEASGAFRLAKVNVDESPNIAIRYGVRTIPTIKIFSQGEVVSEFVGAVPESHLRDLLGKITPPSPVNLAIERAVSFLQLHQWKEAEELFREILNQNPGELTSLLGLAKTLLVQDKPHEAVEILREFPANKQFSNAKTLLPFAEALLAFHSKTLPEDNDLDAAFEHSIRLASHGNIYAAMDGLLDVLRQDRHYREDKARIIYLSLLELLGEDDPQTRQYRAELANILF
jgi:putative thioredoxin